MSSIPLPALSVRPPQQQAGPLDTYSQVLQVKNQQQAGQLGAERLKQEQMQTQAAQRQQAEDQVIQQTIAANGNDIGKALPELSSKISPQRFLGLQKAHREEADAARKRTDEELSTRIKQGDALSGLITQAQQLPPDQYQAQYPQIVAAARQIKPDLKIPDGQVVPQEMLGQLSIGIMTASQIDKQESEKRAARAEVETERHNRAMEVKPPTSDVETYTNNYLKAKNLEDTPANRLVAHAAFTKETKVDPGVARANIFVSGRMVQVADPNNPGQTIMVPQPESAGMAGASSASVQTPKAEQKYMTSGKGGQQLTAFNTAMVHLDTLDRLADGLKNSNIQLFNKASQEWAKQTGNPAPANFAAAKNAMAGEVASALKASGATDQEIAKVSDTFSNAQSPAQLKGAIGTYRELLGGKRDQLKKQFEGGMQGKPNFGDAKKPDPLGIR
jgi:hypothetical protein